MRTESSDFIWLILCAKKVKIVGLFLILNAKYLSLGRFIYKSCILKNFPFTSSVPHSPNNHFSAFSVCQTISLFSFKFHILRNETKGKGNSQLSEISSSRVRAGQHLCIWNENLITLKIIVDDALQQPAAWWVPLVTYECFRCLGASRGRLTSKGCSLLPRQDRQGSSPTSLDSGALQWPSPRCSLGQSQHQQVKESFVSE